MHLRIILGRIDCAVVLLTACVSGCRYFDIDKTVDYVIAGEARMAAKGFLYPVRHTGFQPLMQIRDASDFVQLFPVMFDNRVREELKQKKLKDGWGFRNWQGEMYGDGCFWRDNPEWSDDKRIHTINITGYKFSEYYQEVYARDVMNLAPAYRDGLAWVYAYFVAEDDSFYGRVDALGRDERKTRGTVSDRYRIMIFRKGQRPNEIPCEMYFCKDSSEGIVSEDGRVMFKVIHIGNRGSPWGCLEYINDVTRGDNGYIRLKADVAWLEKFK